MPSPFPGMDPYLEGPRFFADFHDSLIFCMKAHLQPMLPPNYFAQSRDRVWVEASAPEQEREIFLDIFTLGGPDRELVTSIEILSPTNKTPGKDGRDIYRAKQREMLAAEAHLIEIDLLRSGQHTTAIPRELIEQRFGVFDYQVCLHRWDDSRRFRVYPIRLRDKLPIITVPLKTADGYVELDLQAAFTRCYDESGYARAIAYGRDPVTPPLTDEQAAWAKGLFSSDPASTSPA
jgi:uncharacterized protein DUF4058